MNSIRNSVTEQEIGKKTLNKAKRIQTQAELKLRSKLLEIDKAKKDKAKKQKQKRGRVGRRLANIMTSKQK